MKKLLFLLIAMLPLGLNAQSISESDFEKSEWFSDKDINSFFTSDTISIIKILKYNDKLVNIEKLFKSRLKNTYDYLSILNFSTTEEFTIHQLNNKNKKKIEKTGAWTYNSKDRILYLYVNENLHSTFGFSSNMDGNFVVSTDDSESKTKLNIKEITFTKIK